MKQIKGNRPLSIALGMAGIFVCLVLTTGSFFIGRWTAGPDQLETAVESIIETVEVTRQVPATPEQRDDQAGDAPTRPDVEAPPSPTDASSVDAGVGDGAGEAAVQEEPTAEPRPPREISQEDFALLLEVWDLLQEQYDGDVPPDEALFYSAIQGSVETLDDEYTRFVPPDVAERSREQLEGSYEGIGAFVGETEEGFFEIVRPIDDQPADKVGLLAGDIVVAVDGVSVLGKSLDEIINLVKGPRGTDVTLTIRREGMEDFDVTITRAAIEIPIIESEMLEDNIAYARLTSFSSNAEEQLVVALNELLAQNPRALIFDLRDNPGGFLNQALSVTDLFLDGGVILFERNNRGFDQTYSAREGGLVEELPLVVLVNAGSASASEIVAGAIQDNGRGVLIGETTFGKGSVQQPNTLSDGSELRVTIARWYTPNNRSISGEGIAPDIEIPTPEDLGGENDIQLQRAIDYILNGE